MSDILLFPPSLLALENTREKKKKKEGDFWTEQLPEQNFSLIFFFSWFKQWLEQNLHKSH